MSQVFFVHTVEVNELQCCLVPILKISYFESLEKGMHIGLEQLKSE